GANAHLIDPALPGVAFVRLEGSPMPVRVRAAYVCDADIDAMAAEVQRASSASTAVGSADSMVTATLRVVEGAASMPTPTGKTTRGERLAQPLARVVAEQVAADHGVCIRPVALRRSDTTTGASEVIDVPCGSTLESRCPACARRKRSL